MLDLHKLDKDSFLASVSAAAGSSDRGDAFVFIHGYSVTFAEAVRRTAQIAFDLGFRGAPICFSWPSRGRYAGYPADEATIDWTEPHLLKFLELLSSQKGIKSIHLLAHSMGNRALVRCLERIATTKAATDVPFHQTVLAAPDIDAGVFEALAARFGSVAERITLYASSIDRPLRWSRDFHSYPRAGDSSSGIVVVEGVDTVDASDIPTGFLDPTTHANRSQSKMCVADPADIKRWSKIGVGKLIRQSGFSQTTVYKILEGEPVRGYILASFKQATDRLT